jgi:hypothetical protein
VRAIVALALAASPASVFCGDRQIAFERDQAVWIANLDRPGEKKIADGIFPAISPDGPRVAFKAVRVTGKDDYVWEPFWLTANEFLCIMQKENEREPSSYPMSLDGKNPKLLVKHARTPSASAP